MAEHRRLDIGLALEKAAVTPTLDGEAAKNWEEGIAGSVGMGIEWLAAEECVCACKQQEDEEAHRRKHKERSVYSGQWQLQHSGYCNGRLTWFDAGLAVIRSILARKWSSWREGTNDKQRLADPAQDTNGKLQKHLHSPLTDHRGSRYRRTLLGASNKGQLREGGGRQGGNALERMAFHGQTRKCCVERDFPRMISSLSSMIKSARQ